MSRTLVISLALCILAALALAGCDTSPTPTPTPAVTDTPTAPPTDTPTPTLTYTPSPSPTPTRSDVLPQAIAISFNKTRGARALRYEFESSVTLTKDGKEQVVPGLSLSGIDSTPDRHVTISGTTSDTNEFITYEVMVLGDRVFLKGLTGVNNVDPAQWYELPPDAQSGVRQLPSALGLLASFDPADFGKAEFRSSGSETIDDETCSVWTSTKPEFARNLVGVTEDSDLRKQLGEIDDAVFKLWTCADGYVHLMTGQVTGHDTANPADKTTVTLRFAMADFDQPMELKAPENVKPFPAQGERRPATTTPASEAPTTPADTTPTTTPEGGATTTPADATPNPAEATPNPAEATAAPPAETPTETPTP